jgi:uncharacterized protein with ParB-like and HNH nuclease domain
MSQDLGLKARECTIEDILFSNLRFTIPRYQRPYSWGIDHVTDFWGDLVWQDDSDFIGSFIFNHESLKESGVIEVIDGQQRLLTITIFMSVLRNMAKELGANDVASRYERHCIMFEDKKGNQTPRIECGDSTKDFFWNYVQDHSNSMKDANHLREEERKIKGNYEFFYQRVKEELNKYSEKSKKLKGKVLKQPPKYERMVAWRIYRNAQDVKTQRVGL